MRLCPFPWEYRIWETNTAPLIYLNGLSLFVAGLSIVCMHNRWTRRCNSRGPGCHSRWSVPDVRSVSSAGLSECSRDHYQCEPGWHLWTFLDRQSRLQAGWRMTAHGPQVSVIISYYALL